MLKAQRCLHSILMVAGLALLMMTSACAVRRGYRVYDPYYRDHHAWNHHEREYYEHRGEHHRQSHGREEYQDRRYRHADRD